MKFTLISFLLSCLYLTWISFVAASPRDGGVLAYGRADADTSGYLAAFDMELREFRDEVGATLIKAKAPADLDDLLVRLADLKARSYFISSNYQLQNTIGNLRNIVSGWQDYLNYVAQGDQRQAEYSLQNLDNKIAEIPVVPRSKLLQMQNSLIRDAEADGVKEASPPYTVNSVTEAIQELVDLPRAETQLKELLTFRETKNEAESQLANVAKLQSALRLINGGNSLLGLNAISSIHYSGRSAWMSDQVEQIRRSALYEAIPQNYRPKETEVEMERVIAASAQHMVVDRDWPNLWEFLKVVKIAYSRNSSTAIPGLDDDIRAIEYYINAQRLEGTGQLASAYSKYNSILSITGKYGPYEATQEALFRIRSEEAAALLEDQRRLAETPQAPIRYDQRSHYYRSRDAKAVLNDVQFKQLIESAVLEQLTVHKAKESVKKSSAAKPNH